MVKNNFFSDKKSIKRLSRLLEMRKRTFSQLKLEICHKMILYFLNKLIIIIYLLHRTNER